MADSRGPVLFLFFFIFKLDIPAEEEKKASTTSRKAKMGSARLIPPSTFHQLAKAADDANA